MNTARMAQKRPQEQRGAHTYGTAPGKRLKRTRGGKRASARRYSTPACIYFALAVILWAVLVLCIVTYALANGILEAKSSSAEEVEIPPLVIENPAWHIEAQEPPAAIQYNVEDLETLALVIYQEAGADACSDDTRQMVGEVFLNRVADDRYPDTFQEVATQHRQYGRLHWTGLCWPERASQEVEAHAVQRAYEMAEALMTGTVARLLPRDVIFQSEHIQGDEVVEYQDGFYFCR